MKHTKRKDFKKALHKISAGDYNYRGYRITRGKSNGFTSIRLWEIRDNFSPSNDYIHLTHLLSEAREMVDTHINLVGHLMTNKELREYS